MDDIEHEFNIEDQMNKHNNSSEAMLYGKMSYGRGPEDDENAKFPAVIAGGRSRPVRLISKNLPYYTLQNFQYLYKFAYMHAG